MCSGCPNNMCLHCYRKIVRTIDTSWSAESQPFALLPGNISQTPIKRNKKNNKNIIIKNKNNNNYGDDDTASVRFVLNKLMQILLHTQKYFCFGSKKRFYFKTIRPDGMNVQKYIAEDEWKKRVKKGEKKK